MKQSFQLQTVTVVFAFYKREKVFKTFQGMKQSFQLQSVTVIFAYHMQLFIIVMKVFKTLKQSFQIQTVSVAFVIAVHRFIQWLIKNGFFPLELDSGKKHGTDSCTAFVSSSPHADFHQLLEQALAPPTMPMFVLCCC